MARAAFLDEQLLARDEVGVRVLGRRAGAQEGARGDDDGPRERGAQTLAGEDGRHRRAEL